MAFETQTTSEPPLSTFARYRIHRDQNGRNPWRRVRGKYFLADLLDPTYVHPKRKRHV